MMRAERDISFSDNKLEDLVPKGKLLDATLAKVRNADIGSEEGKKESFPLTQFILS